MHVKAAPPIQRFSRESARKVIDEPLLRELLDATDALRTTVSRS